MCLRLLNYGFKIDRKEYPSFFKKENGDFVAWKVFVKKDDSKLYSFNLFVCAKKHYRSNRGYVDLSYLEEDYGIYKGIHVFLKKPDKNIYGTDSIVIKCLCKEKDLVAIGWYEQERVTKIPNSAVFDKVEIVPPKGYRVNSRGFIVKIKSKI